VSIDPPAKWKPRCTRGEASSVRAGLLELVRRDGFWEHYNPVTGHGQGAPQFAWTAGLVLDLMAAEGPAQ